MTPNRYDAPVRAWHWLTQPEHIPVITALVALLAAIIGGVVTQLIAGYFKSRGDTRQLDAASKQLNAAEARWQAEQEFERQKLLADHRRELFIRAAHQLQRTREVFTDSNDIEFEWGPDTYMDSVTKEVDKLFMMETESLLIAPEIAADLRGAAGIARTFRDASSQDLKENRSEWLAKYRGFTREAMTAMRTLLGTQPPASEVEPVSKA